MSKQETQIENTAPLSALVPDPRNARKHNERNRALIESALREVGAARSIVVHETGRVLAGNATVEAARHAGFGKVRVVETDGTPRGTCTGVVANPAHDLLELDDTWLVPVVFVVDHHDGVVTIEPPDGLFE